MQKHTNKPSDDDYIPKVWYREFWAWFILAPLIVVVAVSAFTVSVAVRNADDRVIDNYYKEGRMINMRIDEDLVAAKLRLDAQLKFDPAVSEITVQLTANTQHFPDAIELKMSHPSDEGLDHTLILKHIAKGQYQGELTQELSYRWYLRLYPIAVQGQTDVDEPWRLRGEIDFSSQSAVNLSVEW